MTTKEAIPTKTSRTPAVYKTPEVGASGGDEFSLEKHTENKKVERIKVWAVRNKRIKAISIWLTGNSEETFGIPIRAEGEKENKVEEFEVRGEVIVKMYFWANKGDWRLGDIYLRLGWIYIETSKGRIFNFGGNKKGECTKFDVKTGIWVGVHGRCSHDINAMGVFFMMPPSSFKLLDVKYPSLQYKTGTIRKVRGMSFSLQNGPGSKTLTLRVRDNGTCNAKWSIMYPSEGLFEYNAFKPSSMPGEVLIPMLDINSNGDVGWVLSPTFETINIHSETTDISEFKTTIIMPEFDVQHDVQLNCAASIVATMWEGEINIDFEGDIQIDGTDTKLTISGKFSCNYCKVFRNILV